ncbi:hypothetical protein HX823_09275 [Pseudomonas sp. P7759]|uniref:hypothetical protein n=1 Tax=Pseudomonas sp. P7759 TaxID=2738831 RepID=UPI0015A2CE40|nr:hypothetical protein [Pseudomonas sp. P7759]NWC74267.1 hypothetical protein [Pseudomonas sp. P7759]
MNKHTPGPWVVDPDSPTDISPADDLCLVIACISHVDEAGGRWLFGEQSKANANLIAASPDLLAALLNLENDDGKIPEHAWALIQSAIAKATA